MDEQLSRPENQGVVAHVCRHAARDDSLWQRLGGRGSQGAAGLHLLRQELRERSVQAVPSPLRRLLLSWQTAVRAHAARRALEHVPQALRLLEQQRRAWEQACRRATKQGSGFLSRLRCLGLARRLASLERSFQRARLGAEAAEKRAERALVRSMAARMHAERHLGVYVGLGADTVLNGSAQSRAAVIRSLDKRLSCDLERHVALLLSERVRVLLDRKKHLETQLEARRLEQAEAQRLLRSRGDIMLLMRQHYELRRHEWPSQAIERALLGMLGAISADLVDPHRALVNEREALRREIQDAQRRLLVRMERVSRFVVPHEGRTLLSGANHDSSAFPWNPIGITPHEVTT